jgi:hypothetical protein
MWAWVPGGTKVTRNSSSQWHHHGELRFKARAIETLLEAEMEDAARLVMQLPTSGNE